MFNNDVFELYLEHESKKVLEKLEAGKEPLSHDEDKMIMMLKSQTNHFYHLDKELKEDMRSLRQDTNNQMDRLYREMQALREDMDKRFEAAREDMDKRFEAVDKRFEAVDKRFEAVDKRFEAITLRLDRFMIWSLGLTISSTIFLLGMLKWWN